MNVMMKTGSRSVRWLLLPIGRMIQEHVDVRARQARRQVRDVLREATADRLAQLETLPVLRSLARGELDRAAYADLLERLLGWYRPLEYRLTMAARSLGLELDLDDRRRVPLLERDLRHLGRVGRNPAEVTTCWVLPAVETQADLLGVLFALEATTLNARRIMPALATSLGDGPNAGTDFFRACAVDDGGWPALDALLERTPDQAATRRAAFATLSTLEAWLTLG
jgi:heme oxygenase (biliverdin-IX-beta and delta-forming)